MHALKSWEPSRQAEAVARAAKGKEPITGRSFVSGLQSTNETCPAFIVCERCGRSVCVVCVQALARKLDEFKEQEDTLYSKALHKLLDTKLPEDEPPSSTILLWIPGSISHCCELKVRACADKQHFSIQQQSKTAPKKRSRKRKKRKNFTEPLRNGTNTPVDGIFGVVGFDVAIFPSLKYPDTLSLAQIGDSKTTLATLVKAGYHSVIPNRLKHHV